MYSSFIFSLFLCCYIRTIICIINELHIMVLCSTSIFKFVVRRRRDEMWRLKIAEGGDDPYLYSTNEYVGRQIWEFDPNYGTPEERAEVEEARLNFWNNRFQVKPSSDLLWRMQFLREKNFKQTVAQVMVGAGEDITYEIATTALRRAVHFLSALQASDGHWPAENAGPLFFLPPLVMCVYITGHLDTVFSAAQERNSSLYILSPERRWGLGISHRRA